MRGVQSTPLIYPFSSLAVSFFSKLLDIIIENREQFVGTLFFRKKELSNLDSIQGQMD